MNAPLHKEMPAGLLNAETALRDVTQAWDSKILKELTQYIEIPAKSLPSTAIGKPMVTSTPCCAKRQNGLKRKRWLDSLWKSFDCQAAHLFCTLTFLPHVRNLKALAKPC